MIEIKKSRYDNMEFKLLGKIEYFVEFIDIYLLEGCPRTYRVTCDGLRNASYSLISNCAYANINTGNIRNKYQKEILVSLVIIDFYLGVFLDKKVLKEKLFLTLCNMLNEIRKMVYGWMNEK